MRAPAILLALGLASLLMLLGVNRIYEQLLHRDHTRVVTIGKIRLSLATAHLWLEEYLTGDDVDIDEIASHLAGARARIDGLLGEPSLRSGAERVRAGIDEFRKISERRERGFARGEEVGIGSAMDREYDGVFRQLLADSGRLEGFLEDRLVRNRARADLLFRIVFVAWGAIVATSVVGLWSRERRRNRAEAALEVSQAQLLQSQKMDAVGRFAGGIAHDINNYLGAIRAQSETVKMKPDDPERVVKKMDAIIRVVSKTAALIDRLLAFARRQPIKPEVVNLNRVIEDGIGTMVRRLVGEDIRMDTRLEPELWNVSIDPSQMEQVIVNLVVNARQAMPTGGAISIRTANSSLNRAEADALGLAAAGDFVVFAVSDTGSGIAPEDRQRIFEPFFTTKGPASNSGLGLTTVYGIVEQHGGAIFVESEIGRGTTIEIHLPRSTKPARVEVAVEGTTIAIAPEPRRILLVEDNDELRESTRSVLEVLGYQVVPAADGREALELFDRTGDEIDLIMTDVVMPGMNGKELIDRIRARGAEQVRVLFVSGYTDDVILRHGITERKVEFLKKPFSADALATKIAELLTLQRH